jgi:hypothetical protein
VISPAVSCLNKYTASIPPATTHNQQQHWITGSAQATPMMTPASKAGLVMFILPFRGGGSGAAENGAGEASG